MRSFIVSLSIAVFIQPVHSIEIRMSEFTGSFNYPDGRGQVREFSLNQGPIARNAQVNLLIDGENLILNLDEDEYSWEDIPSGLNDLISANWNNLNLGLTQTALQASAQTLQTNSSDSRLSLSQFNLQCGLGSRSKDNDDMDHLLNGCLNRQGKLNLRLLDITNLSGASIIAKLMESLNLGFPSIQSTNRFENIELDIRNNDFTAAVTTRVVINATVRMNGKTFYDKEQEQVRIRIDRARAGFLNVTNMIFDELDKLSSDRVQVSRPWIVINIAQ